MGLPATPNKMGVKSKLKYFVFLAKGEEGEDVVFAVSSLRLPSLREEVKMGQWLFDLDNAKVLLETTDRNEARQFADQKAAELYGGIGSEL